MGPVLICLLVIGFLVSGVAGCFMFLGAHTAIQQILAAIAFVVSAVLLVGACIVSQLERLVRGVVPVSPA